MLYRIGKTFVIKEINETGLVILQPTTAGEKKTSSSYEVFLAKYRLVHGHTVK